MPHVPIQATAVVEEPDLEMPRGVEPGATALQTVAHPAPATSGGRAQGEPVARGRREGMVLPYSAATAVAIQTYWAAAGRSFRLQTLAARATNPDERQALMELEEAEELRREVARRVLNEIWGIDLALRSSQRAINVVPWPVSDHLH